jgi:hypothetical protein
MRALALGHLRADKAISACSEAAVENACADVVEGSLAMRA